MASNSNKHRQPHSKPPAPKNRSGAWFLAGVVIATVAGVVWWYATMPPTVKPAAPAQPTATNAVAFVMGDDAQVFATYAGSASCHLPPAGATTVSQLRHAASGVGAVAPPVNVKPAKRQFPPT